MNPTKRHAIVFLTYNKPALIDSRLDEVDRYLGHRDDFEVHVFDNGSNDYGVRLALISRSQLMEYPLVIHRSEKNLGFGKGFNRAVKHIAADKIVHLISDDVMITGDFIAAHPLPWFVSEVRCHRLIAHGSGWNQFGDLIIPYCDGYYVAMHMTAWERLGGFDERFYPYDYEDVDLGYRVTKDPTLFLVEEPSLPLRHQAASTIGYNDERFEHTVRMRVLFAAKWGLPNEPERP